MSSLSCLHTSCRGYLIPGSTRLIVQYCKHVISRSTTSDDLFVDTTLMATQSLTEENSDLSENEDVHLSELIPAVLENEKDKLKKELKDVKEASVIFHGTTRLGEALAVIVRYVQENFQPTQRLIRLDILAKALKGEELAQRLMSCLAVDYHFGPTAIIGGMRDGASVNGAALRQLMFFYPKLFDVVCFSHTIDNVGNHFEFKILDLFARYWISMFSHSYNARLVWRERTGQSIRTFSETRWWSKWEVLRQVSEYFGDVEPFLRENDEVSPANRRRLLEIFDDPQSCQDLRLELAALVDAGVHFVNATY